MLCLIVKQSPKVGQAIAYCDYHRQVKQLPKVGHAITIGKSNNHQIQAKQIPYVSQTITQGAIIRYL
jgi:hypothetical protein